MVKYKIDKRAESININANSKRTFLLIHGYTGSPTDFNNLPKKLNKEFNANVIVPRLLGHGTHISDLDNFSYSDYINQVEEVLKKEINKGNSVVVGGFSYGGQLALYLAAKYPIRGVFVVSVPYKMSFFLTTKLMIKIANLRRLWRKHFTKEEKRDRKDSFYYEYIPGYSLDVINKTNKFIEPFFDKISCPLFVANSNHDSWIPYRSMKSLLSSVKSKYKEYFIMDYACHGPFYHKEGSILSHKIIGFIKKNQLFGRDKNYEIVDTIVCAYNEEPRIGKVLQVLIKSKIINRIIVIDDGSIDNTYKIAKQFKKVECFRNRVNRGKAFSMDRGVSLSKAPVIFFCDSDLEGITVEHVENIIKPVLDNKFDMFIGICNNITQKTWKLVALNSGQRVIRRELWEKLPKFYKYRFRIEYGLNKFALKVGRNVGYKVLDYHQPFKETKYGFINGTFLRWWLNFDVFIAILRFNFYDRFKRLNF